MARILHVQASPRGERSKSLRVAQAFLESYRERHAEAEVVHLDLFHMDLPPFDGPVLEAKYNILSGSESTPQQLEEWRRVEAIIEQFKSADLYVFSVPMWNFNIPYRLKHYIDILVQPGYTFAYDPEKGFSGLVATKPVVVTYARGGEYASPEAVGLDFQKPYLETILGFIGLTDVHSISIEPTMAGEPELVERRLEQAVEKARQLAASLEMPAQKAELAMH